MLGWRREMPHWRREMLGCKNYWKQNAPNWLVFAKFRRLSKMKKYKVLGASAIAGFLAAFFFLPFDYMKSRMQHMENFHSTILLNAQFKPSKPAVLHDFWLDSQHSTLELL